MILLAAIIIIITSSSLILLSVFIFHYGIGLLINIIGIFEEQKLSLPKCPSLFKSRFGFRISLGQAGVKAIKGPLPSRLITPCDA